MAESENNLILRLLRDIRAKQDQDGLRLIRVERRLDELHESVGMALGMAAHANVVVEQAGQSFDQIRAELAALKARVDELEAR